MPGSYPAPETLADNALETLRHAYQERQSAEVGSLILKAHELIARLKEEIRSSGNDAASKEDPYEINEHNSAIFCAAD
jgi:hypothetical protein